MSWRSIALAALLIPIWPGPAPDLVRGPGPVNETVTVHDKPVAGRPWTFVSNVVQPTVTVYTPAHDNTGAAVVVFPGGGYTILAIELEGSEVCDWLTARGITCVVLKYRVPGLQFYPKPAYPKSGPYPFSPMALEDAQRTVGLVRYHAAEWHIDPHKIGVLGFSAGGHLVAAISTHYEKRLYKPVDRADEVSCRPDFAVLLYPGHLTVMNIDRDARFGNRKPLAHGTSDLNPDIRVTSRTPPAFIVQAIDDPVDSVNNSRIYYRALKRAGVPVEMHLFEHGGHAFGIRRTKQPITAWPELLEKWLRKMRIIPPSSASSAPARFHSGGATRRSPA
jgi:acetyl esterase/lipase